MMTKDSTIGTLKGIGEKTEQLFRKLEVVTIDDLLHYYPRGYEVYEEPTLIQDIYEERTLTVNGTIQGRPQVLGTSKKQITSLYLRDQTGILRVIWFHMPFLKHTLQNGAKVTLRGFVRQKQDAWVMEHPEVFCPGELYQQKLNTLQPMYSLTSGITNHTITKAIKQSLEQIPTLQDTLPEELRKHYHFVSYQAALQGIHFPVNKEEFYQARERLVFEEFLQFILSMRVLKSGTEKENNPYKLSEPAIISEFLKALPYELTTAQKRVWNEIKKDMMGVSVMSRLIQGDVGSGKTIIAVLGLFLVGLNGYQGAMMAPTEVLARQHYASIGKLLLTYQIPLHIVLLTGSMKAKEKQQARTSIANGQAQIIIGTHALIQEKVEYKNLALVITDEQHRFGVRQRELFTCKGKQPHILVMSATPIPRTLAIIIYGDLDISVIDELPANRLPIKNCVVEPSYRKTAYAFINEQVCQGRQCYIICPMVEESEHLEAENVMDYSRTLQEKLGSNVSIAYLHGKMNQTEKDGIMARFIANQIHVLVSTTVIEVGIDVPNATVMMIENAERFGLAQLHQLRGRVGRGNHQSYCIFMSGSKSKETKQRLDILKQTNDGFKIASEDLKLRGPGDLFGIKQSGLMDFCLGDVYQDAALLGRASEAADVYDLENYQNMTKHARTSSVSL